MHCIYSNLGRQLLRESGNWILGVGLETRIRFQFHRTPPSGPAAAPRNYPKPTSRRRISTICVERTGRPFGGHSRDREEVDVPKWKLKSQASIGTWRAAAIPATVKIVWAKLKEVAKARGVPQTEFKASKGWVQSFVKQFGCSLRRRKSVCRRLRGQRVERRRRFGRFREFFAAESILFYLNFAFFSSSFWSAYDWGYSFFFFLTFRFLGVGIESTPA